MFDGLIQTLIVSQLLKFKPDPKRVDKAKLKSALHDLVNVAVKSTESTIDDNFESRLCDVLDEQIDRFIVSDEPMPMGAADADLAKIAQEKGVSPFLIAILTSLGTEAFKRLLKRWFPDLAI